MWVLAFPWWYVTPLRFASWNRCFLVTTSIQPYSLLIADIAVQIRMSQMIISCVKCIFFNSNSLQLCSFISDCKILNIILNYSVRYFSPHFSFSRRYKANLRTDINNAHRQFTKVDPDLLMKNLVNENSGTSFHTHACLDNRVDCLFMGAWATFFPVRKQKGKICR